MSWPDQSSGNVRTIARTAVPRAIPSSGSIAANGALTLTTFFAATYSGGIYLYFPANAVYAGSPAAFYFTIMSSFNVGTIYAETYTSGNPIVPANPTAIVAAGPGAYTQSTTEITLHTSLIPAGAIGNNGMLQTTFSWSNNNNADTKTLSVKLGGTTTWSRGRTTTISEANMMELANRGRLDRQVEITNLQNGSVWAGAVGSAKSTYSINTAVDVDHIVTGSVSAGASFILLESFTAEISYRQ